MTTNSNVMEQAPNWWVGVVESRNDPEQLGRCKVRIHGAHTEDLTAIPTNSLPWAWPILPFGSNQTDFRSPPQEGTWVFGQFRDGSARQEPFIIGLLQGKNSSEEDDETGGFKDLRNTEALSAAPRFPGESAAPKGPRYKGDLDPSPLSRGAENAVLKTSRANAKFMDSLDGVWQPPTEGGSPKYPYNTVTETESGHTVEYDDTPGAERICIRHRNGTSIEIQPGSMTTRITGDGYELVSGNKYLHVAGSLNVTIVGDAAVKVTGSMKAQVGKELSAAVEGSTSITSKGAVSLRSDAAVTVKAAKGLSLAGEGIVMNGGAGAIDIKAGGAVTVNGSTVNLN